MFVFDVWPERRLSEEEDWCIEAREKRNIIIQCTSQAVKPGSCQMEIVELVEFRNSVEREKKKKKKK